MYVQDQRRTDNSVDALTLVTGIFSQIYIFNYSRENNLGLNTLLYEDKWKIRKKVSIPINHEVDTFF